MPKLVVENIKYIILYVLSIRLCRYSYFVCVNVEECEYRRKTNSNTYKPVELVEKKKKLKNTR